MKKLMNNSNFSIFEDKVIDYIFENKTSIFLRNECKSIYNINIMAKNQVDGN